MSLLDFMYDHCSECGKRVRNYPDSSTEKVVIVREVKDRKFLGLNIGKIYSDHFCKDCCDEVIED